MKFKLISALAIVAVPSLAIITPLVAMTNNVNNNVNKSTILETNNIKHAENVQVVNYLNEIQIVDVFGYYSTFGAIVNNNGKQEIYMWGNNAFGQLGLGDTSDRLVPTLLDSSKLGNYNSVKELIVGIQNSLIIVNTDRGEEIYVVGSNGNGELGIGNTTNQSNPVLFDTTIFGNFNSIKEMVIGSKNGYSSYAIILDQTGNEKIFVWGHNADYRLGIGNATNQSKPVLFNTTNLGEFARIKEFKIETHLSYLVLQRNNGLDDMYTWGVNGDGQVGNGTKGPGVSVISKVNVVSGKNIKFVRGIYAAVFVVITNNGVDELYRWGDNAYGQLINGSISNGDMLTPARIPQSELFNATEIDVINGRMSMFASVKINGQTKLLTWARSDYGETMTGSTGVTLNPILIDNSKLGNFTEVYSSVFTHNIDSYWPGYSCYAYVKTSSGDKLYTWGDNSYGQLGIGNNTRNIYSPVEVSGLDLSTAKITKFPSSFNYSIILELERNNQVEIFATGSNSAGQLALNNTTNVLSFTRILPLGTSPKSKIITSKLTAGDVLNLINPKNVINLVELEKYVDTTSFPANSTLSIDMSKTTTNLEQGILNLAITTNKYNPPLIPNSTITGSKTFEVPINGLWKATNINTNPIFVREALFPNQDKITIKELYGTICDGAGKVINRPLLEQYLDLTSIPQTAQLYLLPNSLDDPINATFTLKSNEVYLNGITTVQEYSQQDLIISLQEITNWALIISLSVVGGVLLIAALVGFILVKRNVNKILI